MQRHILSHAIGKIKRPKKFLQMQWEFLIMDKCGPQGTGKGNGMKTSTLDTHLGKIAIGTDVIAQYAGAVAMECFGIVGMANVNVRDGLVNLLKSDNIKKGIHVKISEAQKLTLEFHVIVSYGVSISAVADNLIDNVKYKVEEFTGLGVEKINVFVEGVRVID